MRNIPKIVLIAATLAMPGAAFAQAVGTGASGGVVNPVPGGITLVPGTVVTPGTGGSAVTGTVPFPGTVGSPGIGNLNPGLGTTPNPGIAGNNGALYPPAFYPQTPLPGTVQNTLPNGTTTISPSGSSLAPSVPGGPTLVPGTVVTPGIGGSAVTGTVPLPGTVRSPGIGNLNPGLGTTPNLGIAGNNGALYPPQTPLPGTVQNTLPNGMTTISPSGSSVSPSSANCPGGLTPVTGKC